MLKRLFHCTSKLNSRWAEHEIATLNKAYQELGSSWDLVAEHLPGRKAKECKRKFNSLSVPSHITNSTEMEAHIQGLERHSDIWIDVPVENVASRNASFYPVLKIIPFFRSRGEHKRAGWHPNEDIYLREAYDHYGPNWKHIACYMQHRTPTQCRNRMIALYKEFNLQAIEEKHENAMQLGE